MLHENSKGPRTDPCGKPVLTLTLSEETSIYDNFLRTIQKIIL